MKNNNRDEKQRSLLGGCK